MKFQFTYVALLATSILFHSAHADDAVSIDDFGFLTGTWIGTGMGGKSEEMWMPPSDGRMFGIFKQSSEEGLIFSELMEITQVDGKFILRLKHFNPDFSGWEDKDEHLTFTLDSVANQRAAFGSLRYEVIGGETLKIDLDMRQSNGDTVTEVFTLRRVQG